MWNKIYTAALGIVIVLSAGLAYYSFSWLQSIGAPESIVENYIYYSNGGRVFLWISSLILLIIANVVLWTTRNAWAMWATFLYFAVFILIQSLWLDPSFFKFQQRFGFTDDTLIFGNFFGILFCVLAAVIVFFNQFIVKRMHDKMFAQTQVAIENQTTSETTFNKDNI